MQHKHKQYWIKKVRNQSLCRYTNRVIHNRNRNRRLWRQRKGNTGMTEHRNATKQPIHATITLMFKNYCIFFLIAYI